MEYSIIQIALVFVVTFIAAIDQFDFLESLYQPIVTGAVIGLILGDLNTGLLVGGTYQLMTIGNMPIGGAQPPNAVIGGIMAAILAIATGLEPNAAVGLAIPFALLGQLGVTLVFTLMSPLMSTADNMAHNADTKGIERLNYFAMALLGLIFAVVVTLFFIAGATIGQTIACHPDLAADRSVRCRRHDALRRLRRPAQGYDEPRYVGLLPHGLWPRAHHRCQRFAGNPCSAHPRSHRLRHRFLGLPAADRAEGCSCF